MARFTVYEVQEVHYLQRWSYEIEAETAAEALAIAQAGDGEPIDHGRHGDVYEGESGWTVENHADRGGLDNWEVAREDFEAREAAAIAGDKEVQS